MRNTEEESPMKLTSSSQRRWVNYTGCKGWTSYWRSFLFFLIKTIAPCGLLSKQKCNYCAHTTRHINLWDGSIISKHTPVNCTSAYYGALSTVGFPPFGSATFSLCFLNPNPSFARWERSWVLSSVIKSALRTILHRMHCGSSMPLPIKEIKQNFR